MRRSTYCRSDYNLYSLMCFQGCFGLMSLPPAVDMMHSWLPYHRCHPQCPVGHVSSIGLGLAVSLCEAVPVRTRDKKRYCHTILSQECFFLGSTVVNFLFLFLCPALFTLSYLVVSLSHSSRTLGGLKSFVGRLTKRELPLSYCSHNLLSLYSQLGLHNLWNKLVAETLFLLRPETRCVCFR